MPRYFFHLHNDIDAPDHEGHDQPNDHAALEAALDFARDIANASVRKGHLDLKHFIVCVAEDGREVGIVRFANAVRVES
jgi:hypothetical protein